ncbi:endo-beta-1,4-xylanase [Paramyrothecium foliicola]|nr:endo-beta-1,4-xylanase [Paramyrothecium foliicola]
MMKSLFLVITCLGIALASPLSGAADLDIGSETPEKPPSGSNPLYVLYENEEPSTVNFTTSLNSPSFEVNWRRSAYFQIGKGWRRGIGRNVTYAGYYQPQGNSLIGITGWTKNPLIEYLITDNFGTW